MTDRAAVIAAEQRAVDHAYECRARAERDRRARAAAPSTATDAKAGTTIIPDVPPELAATGDLGDAALITGRVEFVEDGAERSLLIGRQSVFGPNRDLVVANWASRLVRQWMVATPADPGDLLLRRQLRCHGRTVRDYFDQLSVARKRVTPEDGGTERVEPVPAQRTESPGEEIERLRDYLLEDLGRARDGAMRDIVETIQRAQYLLVSDERTGALVVQGGPGTGKTAVGLHRVYYLVFNNVFATKDVLVVGPHKGFLQHVRDVLPRLGTGGVALAERDRLWGKADAHDPLAARMVKSSARMVEVLRRGVADFGGRRALTRSLSDGEFRLVYQGVFLAVPQAELESLLTWESGPYRAQRPAFGNRLVDLLVEAYRAVRPGPLDAGLRKQLERHPQVQKVVNAVRPQLSAEQVLRALLTDADVLDRAAEGILDDEDRRAILRERRPKMSDEPWSLEDLVCLDELRYLLTGDVPVRYRHLVVDEAQDLTPMQARALARRCPSGSMTVLGDLAQASGLHRWDTWEDLAKVLTGSREWHLEQLSVGYRVPREVMELAAPLATAAAPQVVFPTSIRSAGEDAVTFVETTSEDLIARATEQAHALTDEQRSVAVVVPDALIGAARDGMDEGVRVIRADECKGLEFDHVIVVEPADIADRRPGGLGLLYVALTRCTQSLTVVHARPLPRELAPSAEREEAPMPTPMTDFAAVLEKTVAVERECHVHESVRYSLVAELHASRMSPDPTSTIADLVFDSPAGRVLYEVLGENGHRYPAMREAVLRLVEVERVTGATAAHRVVVLPQPPEQPWSAEVLREVFGVAVIWKDGTGWQGDPIPPSR
ncbi:hypothetical protein AB0J52_01515 [Spirillospora sp. NPDC049652]